MALVTGGQLLDRMRTGWGRISSLFPLHLEVSGFSFRHFRSTGRALFQTPPTGMLSHALKRWTGQSPSKGDEGGWVIHAPIHRVHQTSSDASTTSSRVDTILCPRYSSVVREVLR